MTFVFSITTVYSAYAGVPFYGDLKRGFHLIIHTANKLYTNGSVSNNVNFDLKEFSDGDYSKVDKRIQNNSSWGNSVIETITDAFNNNLLDSLEDNGAHYIKHGLYAINGILFNYQTRFDEIGQLPEAVVEVPAYYKGYFFTISIVKESFEITMPNNDSMNPLSYVESMTISGSGAKELNDTGASFYRFLSILAIGGIYFSLLKGGLKFMLRGGNRSVKEEVAAALGAKIIVFICFCGFIAIFSIIGELLSMLLTI